MKFEGSEKLGFYSNVVDLSCNQQASLFFGSCSLSAALLLQMHPVICFTVAAARAGCDVRQHTAG